MTRELVVFQKEEVGGGIVVVRDGTISRGGDARSTIAALKPGDVVDFVRLAERTDDDKPIDILVVSDVPVDDVEGLFGEGAKHVAPEDIPTRAGSWALPLSIPAIFERSIATDGNQAFYALNSCARYLESGAQQDQVSPWNRGRVAATVRAHWDTLREKKLVSGESHWGWIKDHYFNNNGGEGWDKVKGKFECWMRCADVFLRNVENQEWITELTLNEIFEIPISRALICCRAIKEGLFEHSDKIKQVLLDPVTTNDDMRHWIATIKGHRDKLPERIVDEETGEILYVDSVTGEMTEELSKPVLDEYLPSYSGFAVTEERDAPIKPRGGVFWTLDWERGLFGYWKDNTWIPGLQITNMHDRVIREFVEEIIGQCEVNAEYDRE